MYDMSREILGVMLGSLWRWVEIESELKQETRHHHPHIQKENESVDLIPTRTPRQTRQRSTECNFDWWLVWGDIDIGIGRCAFGLIAF